MRNRNGVERERDRAPQEPRNVGGDEAQAVDRRDYYAGYADAQHRGRDQDLAAPDPVGQKSERPLRQCSANHGRRHEPGGKRRLGGDGARENRRQGPEGAIGESGGEATDRRGRGNTEQAPEIDFDRLWNHW